jgi:hypothetical protein
MASEHDHGHTPAAWTGVIIAFVGFCIAGGFMVAAIPVGFWAGIVLTLVGAVVGGVMKLMGMGKNDEPIATTPATTRTTDDEERVHADA